MFDCLTVAQRRVQVVMALEVLLDHIQVRRGIALERTHHSTVQALLDGKLAELLVSLGSLGRASKELAPVGKVVDHNAGQLRDVQARNHLFVELVARLTAPLVQATVIVVCGQGAALVTKGTPLSVDQLLVGGRLEVGGRGLDLGDVGLVLEVGTVGACAKDDADFAAGVLVSGGQEGANCVVDE